MFAKDTSHRTVFPVFTAGGGFGMPEMEGAADVLMVPDPLSFRVLPWAPSSGWLLCDVYFANGRPVPFATRNLYRSALDRLGKRGYDFVAGLEVEFHIFKLEDVKMSPEDAGQPGQPPSVSLLSHGYQYLTTRWSRCSRLSGATSSRSGCRCGRSRSSSVRASANSRSRRGWGSNPPTP
jgi:glutamine synthetase